MKIAIIGDFNSSFRPHVATIESIEHSKQSLGLQVEADWVSTDYIADNFNSIIDAGRWLLLISIKELLLKERLVSLILWLKSIAVNLLFAR